MQAIRTYVRDVDPEQLRSEMGAGAADIGQVVSDVGDRLPGLQAPPQLEPEQARFRLFDSITAFLKSAGRRQPLVLVLDDLHWADHPSLLLLEFVAQELGNARLMVIGTYRDVDLSRQHPLSQSLGELTRSAEGGFQRVLLRGLDQSDVGRFIELASGVTPPTGMVEAVHRQTEGNPLFVTEVVRLLVQEGELTQENAGQRDSWSVRIPEGVREVIGRRLDRLSERCNETLTIASVVGREFTVDQLSPLIEDISGDRLLEVLDEALAARVIEELPSAVGRYQFTHALIQETLAEELSTTRKVRLHARIAEALELLYGADAEVHAAQLAYHFAEAATVTGPEKLVLYSSLAGERALLAYGWEEALTHFERGAAAKGLSLDGTEPASDADSATLLFGLGQAQAGTLPVYQLHQGVATLSRAFEYFAASGDIDRAVAIAEYPIPSTAGYRAGMSDLIARALDLVPPTSLPAGRLLSLYGSVINQEEGDYNAAQEALSKALDIANQEGDVALELRTLADAGEVAMHHGRFEEMLDLSLRAASLSGRVDDPRSEAMLNYHAAIAFMSRGEPQLASRHAEAGVAAAERLRHHFYLGRALFVSESLACNLGQWEAAREFGDRGLALSPREPRLLLGRVLLEGELGELGAAESYLDRVLEKTRLSSGPTLDRAELAEEAAHIVVSSPSATPTVVEVARIGLSLLAVERADPQAAQEQYESLVPSGIGLVMGTEPDHLLGLLGQTMGKMDEAASHFEDSLAFCRRAGYRPELAWTCCDYADTLLQRNGEGDRVKANSFLDESLAISSELGMRPLMERVLSRREILGA